MVAKLASFNFSLHVTTNNELNIEKVEDNHLIDHISYGRPNFDVKIREISFFNRYNSLVFACGPMSMIKMCSETTKAYGIDFRHETFEL